MLGERIRMMSTERLALLGLALLLLAWALIAMIKKDNGFEVTEPQIIVRVDTIVVATPKSKQINTDGAVSTPKPKSVATHSDRHRDHLNEPVANE